MNLQIYRKKIQEIIFPVQPYNIWIQNSNKKVSFIVFQHFYFAYFQMKQNEQTNLSQLIKKQAKQQVQTTQFFNEQLIDKKHFRKIPTREIISFNTQPISRSSSPQRLDRKYHVKSGFNLHRKYVSKGASMQKSAYDKSVGEIFKRRVNSQSKVSKKPISDSFTPTTQKSAQFKLDFAKKIIEDLKRQTFKMRKNNHRYDSNNMTSKSVQMKSKKLLNRQSLIKNSLQKLKPAFNINLVKLQASKKSFNEIQPVNESKIMFSLVKKHKTQNLQQRIASVLSKQQTNQGYQLIARQMKKSSQPLDSYLEYVCRFPQNTKYEIKLDFLNQYMQIKQKSELFVHIDMNSMKLLQSIYLCIIDIFSSALNQTGQKMSNSSINYDIIRQYGIVYLQMYSKLKIEYILCEVFFKSLKKKLAQFFILQRLLFYWIVECCLRQQIDQSLMSFAKMISVLKLGEQILLTILNMFFCEDKTDYDSTIDTFKCLRLTRQLDKRIPMIKQVFQTINTNNHSKKREKSHKNALNSYFFGEINSVMLSLMVEMQKDDNFNLINVFKLQQYYNWNNLMIPPLFFLPSNSSKPYTLIIDLDQTLVFYSQQSRILKYRPYMDRFLNSMRKYFQIIMFSSHAKQRTDIIIKQIQRDERIFQFTLYKSHMVFQQGALRKNIGYLGRNLQRLVFIDDEEKNTKWLSSNSFQIKSFTGDKQDKELLNISDWLTTLMQEKPSDVRGKLKRPQKFLDEIAQIDEISSTIQRTIHNQQQ